MKFWVIINAKETISISRKSIPLIFFCNKTSYKKTFTSICRYVLPPFRTLSMATGANTSVSTNTFLAPLSFRNEPKQARTSFCIWKPPKPRKMLSNSWGRKIAMISADDTRLFMAI